MKQLTTNLSTFFISSLLSFHCCRRLLTRAVLIFSMTLSFSHAGLCWNAMGHRIAGQIAYENLTPHAKEEIDDLVAYLSNAYPYSSTFQTANSWADTIKNNDVHAFDTWHYYGKFYTDDGTTPQDNLTNSDQNNVLWAINQSLSVLQSTKSHQNEKALFLRFLLHFVEDAHQPLHCINRYEHDYPNGDRGGNLVSLGDNHNLHQVWDDGLGLFDKICKIQSRIFKSKSQQAKCLAKQFQLDYPKSYFSNQINELDPAIWVNESYNLAIQNVYPHIHPHEPLSEKYIESNQPIVEQRIVLSGYRLAQMLNGVFK